MQPNSPSSREIEDRPCALPRRIQVKRLVVGYDFGDAGDAILKVAIGIAKEFQAELFVVHSIPPSPTTLGVVGEPAEEIGKYLDDARYRIEETIKKTNSAIQRKVILGLDSPVDLMERVATEQKVDLIVVGTRGRHGLKQLFGGSVSQSISGRVNCPVLILGPEFSLKENLFQTILFATDLEETGIGAAQYAGGLACDHCCRLVMLHVLPKKPSAEGRMREWVEENTREKLYRLLDTDSRLESDHEALIAYGEPEEEILAVADSKHADLIILGGRDHIAMGDRASWRTLTKIAQNARCPVLRVAASAK